MGIIRKKYSIIILVILILFLGAMISYGIDSYHENNVVIQKDKIIRGDYIRAAQGISNQGTIIGDLIGATERLKQSGIVEGDLVAIASDIGVEGIVKGNLRLAAQDIRIRGEVYRNASMFASSVLLEEGAVIDGSIHIFAGELNLKGLVGGDIRGGAGTAIISGTVKGNIKLNVDKLYIEPGAVVEGDLIYISNREQEIDPTMVKGKIIFEPATKSDFQVGLDELRDRMRLLSNIRKVIFLGSYILIGVLLIKFLKRPYQRTRELIEEKPWYSIGLGVSVLIGTPVAALLLIFTLMGIPFSILGMTFYGILVYLAKIPVALWLGGKIIRDEERNYISFIVGILLIATLGLIPFVGALVSMGVTALGSGVTLIMIKEYYKKKNDGEIIP